MRLSGYDCAGFYDEMFEPDGSLRAGYRILGERLADFAPGEVARKQAAAERALYGLGITFNVYSDGAGTEKIFPFDIVPRIVPAHEWRVIESGLRQRITALNLFIADIYKDQKVLRDGVVPRQLIESSKGYLPGCHGMQPPGGIWCHVTGTDLVRDRDGRYYVLEDNLRCPSGVSYVLSNRAVMKRTLPQVFDATRVRPVDLYPSRLLETLQSVAPARAPEDLDGPPTAVVLTPGRYNSAYYEHSFLAQQMGIELVEGGDLVVDEGWVKMRTTRGLRRVDVIYRRIDDTFLDPRTFRADSMLGVPGLIDVYRAGRVSLCNAPGTGVADDKVIYAYVPKLIRYYLSEDPILANVPTYLCGEEKELTYVLEHLPELVVKAAGESGGYGMLVGPASTKAEQAEFASKLRAEPRNYIAQPVIGLSRVPTLLGGAEELAGRHVDLRPYVLYGGGGQPPYVLPGGLTRVALRAGSLVVNSSQGGGSKDTWVLYDDGGSAC